MGDTPRRRIRSAALCAAMGIIAVVALCNQSVYNDSIWKEGLAL